MSINPSHYILDYHGTGQPGTTTFTCRGITGLDVSYIYGLKMSRLTGREQGSTIPTAIASVRDGGSASIPDNVTDILNRATVSGGIDTQDPTQSSIVLEFRTIDFTCEDAGQYFCDFHYEDSLSSSHIVSDSTIFTISGMYMFIYDSSIIYVVIPQLRLDPDKKIFYNQTNILFLFLDININCFTH